MVFVSVFPRNSELQKQLANFFSGLVYVVCSSWFSLNKTDYLTGSFDPMIQELQAILIQTFLPGDIVRVHQMPLADSTFFSNKHPVSKCNRLVEDQYFYISWTENRAPHVVDFLARG